MVIYTLILLEVRRRTRWWCLKCVIVFLARDIPPFVMYCVNGKPRSSLFIESTDCTILIYINIQWNLRIKDNLGPGILSLVRRLVSLGGQPIFSLKMPYFMLSQVYYEELDLNFYK